jgi:hypothetical protein
VLQQGDGVGAARKEIAQGGADRLWGQHEVDVAPKTLVEGQRHRAACMACSGWRDDPVAVKDNRAGYETHHTLSAIDDHGASALCPHTLPLVCLPPW